MKKLIFIFAMLFSLNISATVTISPTSISSDTALCQHNYLKQLTATGGTAPYTWSVSVGHLPLGLFLGAKNGQIYGTINLTNDTSVTFTVRATDKHAVSGTRAYTIYIKNNLVTYADIIPYWSGLGSYIYPTRSQLYDTYRNFATAGAASGSSWNGGGAVTSTATFGTTTPFGINFITNDSTRLTLTSIGRLGINQLAPLANLHVNGFDNTANHYVARFENLAGNNALSIDGALHTVMGNADNTTGGYMHVMTCQAGNGLLLVKDGGNTNVVNDFRLQIIGNAGADLSGFDDAGHVMYSMRGQIGSPHFNIDNDAHTGALAVDNIGVTTMYHNVKVVGIAHDSTGLASGSIYVGALGVIKYKY